ncbi:MAG: carboxypeptidase-like regulatory domain-containing protein [Planctomycetes bacterium]|nr:carboxypeptidase-like regulatory domain-containing protein [Planctomycetota bacterium]
MIRVGSNGRSHVLLVALGVCVALLGGAAWWLFVERPVQTLDGAELVDPMPPSAGDSAAGSTSTIATPANQLVSPELVVPRDDARAEQRSAVAAPPTSQPAKRMAPGLVIVDADSGAPLAAADVWVTPFPRKHRLGTDDLAELVELAEREGKRERADAAGGVRVPGAAPTNPTAFTTQQIATSAEWFVVAATKERWGAGRVRAGPHGAKLALHRDGPLDVVVHDAERRPLAGVPLVLAQFHETNRTFARRSHAKSDANGRAVFEHGRAWLERAHPAPLSVCVDGAFERVPRRSVTLDDLTAPVSLEVPPFGAVDVKVLDFDGRELTTGAEVRLASTELELAIIADAAAELTDGRVRYPAVQAGVDTRFEARLRIAKTFLAPFSALTRLERAGERVELVLGGPNAVPTLVARVLDDDGAVYANRALDVQVETVPNGGAPSLISPVQTDAEGIVKLHLAGWRAVAADGQFSGEPGLASGGALRLVAAPSGERKVRSVVVEVPLAPKLGLNDLGDVHLAGLPLLVAGRVVDQIGAPIANANVNVLAQNSDGTTWRDTGAAALTDGDGRFSIDAEFPGAELAVRASSSDSQRGAPVLFAPGISGVELPLERWASLDVTATIDPDLNPAELNVVWTLDDVATALIGTPRPASDGLARAAFSNHKLRAGRGKLQVLAVSTPVLAFEPFELLPGPNPDALRDLDLRNLVRIVDLVIRDHEGRDVAAGEIRFRPSGTDEAWQSWRFTRGRARLLALAPELDLSVFGAPGRTTLFERVRDDATLVLDGPLWATVELAGGNPVSAPDTLKLAFTLIDSRGVEVATPLRGTWEALVDADGRVKVAFAAAGKHSVAFRVMHAASGKGRELAEQQTFDVALVDHEQSFKLEPPRAALERALAELADAASQTGGR